MISRWTAAIAALIAVPPLGCNRPLPDRTATTTAGPGAGAQAPRPDPPASPTVSAGTTADAGADAAAAADAGAADDSAVARYFRRAWSIQRGGGTVVFEAPEAAAGCKPLPSARPLQVSVILSRRGSEPEDTHWYGVVDAPPCRFSWSMPWMEPPPASCRAIGAAAYDRLFAELRALDLHTIQVKKLPSASPHRGGWSVSVRWPGSSCEITDIVDLEVHASDRPRFEAAMELIRKAYNQATPSGP